MTLSSPAYDWVREIKPDLKQLDSIPLTGAAPPFPWEDFCARLARSFDREDLKIQPTKEITWRAKENLYEGLGDSPFPLIISIPSFKGQVAWVMPTQEIPLLAALLLTKESHPLPLHDPVFSESFYHFLAIEALYNFTQVLFDQTLSPILTNQKTLPNENSLCWDISLQVQHHTTWGRMIISPDFRHSWVEHFAQKQSTSPLSAQMAQLVPAILHLEAGKTQLNLSEWMSIKLGDVLTLDSCSLDSERLDGRVILTLNGKQTFRAKLKDGTLKILELPLLHEVDTSMTEQPDDQEHFDDLDLPNENENDDLEYDEELLSDDDDDLFADESEELKEEMDTAAKETEETPEEAATPTKKGGPSSSETSNLISPEQIPVTVVIEVGQVELTMDQLLKLEPGNLLDINLHPDQGVDLTINGKLVGKGELIRIGDVIGVRIMQLGMQLVRHRL